MQVFNKVKKGEEVLVCTLCRRQVESLSRHHLIPREEGGNHGPTAELCQPCHSTIHLQLSNRELAQHFNSIETLQKAEALQKYLRWVRNKKITRIANRRSSKSRRR